MTTTIEWCAAPGYRPESWNPIAAFNIETGKRGWACTKPSDGCRNCYSEARNRHIGTGLKYTHGNLDKVRFALVNLDVPMHWRNPRMVFVESMSDLFGEWVTDEMLLAIFAMMIATPNHIYQVLTKRPARMRGFLERYVDDGTLSREAMAHIWFGTTTENQKTADERLSEMMQLRLTLPDAVFWVSAEPLLERIDISPYLDEEGYIGEERVRPIDWVVIGLESGQSAREGEVAWIVDLLAQCTRAGTKRFVKQLGRRPMIKNDADDRDWPGGSLPLAEDYEPHHQGELAPLKLPDIKGSDWEEWPAGLRVREWPSPRTARAA